ncbi:hypothetical protein ACFLY9_02905 [Patescibacteria group bacterium]
MSQETLSREQPDCPYPAFQEVTIEQIERGRILTLDTLLDYLHYVRTQESLPTNTNPLSPSLARACEVVIKLLTRDFPMSDSLTPSKIYTTKHSRYAQSDLLIDFTNPDLEKEELARYRRVALWHGGITGLNEAHFEILALLGQECRYIERNTLIIIGLERNRYLELKDREILRPWPLIVTVSIYAHLAEVYRIPMRLFIMPEIPGLQDDFDQHYEAIYKYIHRLNKNTVLVTTLRDPFKTNKRLRMKPAGLSKIDWDWADLSVLVVCPSTRLVLAERTETYSSLLPPSNAVSDDEEGTELILLLRRYVSDETPEYISGLFLWENL